MKVTAFVSSGTKKHTYNASERFLNSLQSLGNIECEMVLLSDYNIGTCKGCRLCLDHGEEFCPFKDDRDKLIEKMENSDGVIFASPNYSFHVSAVMKIFLDRLAFIFHRPRFFGKTFTCIVTQGIVKGDEIVKYFNFVGKALGFKAVNGCCVKTIEPMTEEEQRKIDKIIDNHSKKFYSQLVKKDLPIPSLFWLLGFRMARTSMKRMLTEDARDYRYFRDKGWFEADYFYPVKLNPFKKMVGKLFDKLAVRIIKH